MIVHFRYEPRAKTKHSIIFRGRQFPFQPMLRYSSRCDGRPPRRYVLFSRTFKLERYEISGFSTSNPKMDLFSRRTTHSLRQTTAGTKNNPRKTSTTTSTPKKNDGKRLPFGNDRSLMTNNNIIIMILLCSYDNAITAYRGVIWP